MMLGFSPPHHPQLLAHGGIPDAVGSVLPGGAR